MYNPDEDRKEYEFNEDPLRDQIENSTWIIEIKILYFWSTLSGLFYPLLAKGLFTPLKTGASLLKKPSPW